MSSSKIRIAAALMLLALAATAKSGTAQCPQIEPRFSIASGTGGAILTSVDQATVPAGACITLRLIIVPEPGTPFDASLSPNTTFTTNPTQGHFTSKNVFCALTSDCNKQFPIYAIFHDPCTGTTLVSTVHITVPPCPPSVVSSFVSLNCTLLPNVGPIAGSCTVAGHTGVCGAIVNFTTPALAPPFVTGGLAPFHIICSPASGSFFPAGTTKVTCTVSDSQSPPSTAKCSFNVTVSPCAVTECSLPPLFSECVPEGLCGATATIVPTISPSCASIASIVCTASIGGHTVVVSPSTVFPFGNTTVSCTVTDTLGNVTHCSTIVRALPAGQSEIKEFVAAVNGVPTTGNPDQVTISVGDCITLGVIITVPNCAAFNGVPFTTFTTNPTQGTFPSANVFCATAGDRNHQFPIYAIFFNPCTNTSQTTTVHVTVRP